MTLGAYSSNFLTLGGHYVSVHAKPDGHIELGVSDIRATTVSHPTSDEARRLAAELLVAAEVADQPPYPTS